MPRKQQRDITLFIVDVFVAIVKTKEYVEPFDDEDEFRHSSLHWDASIRQLEVIGEALNHLLDDEYFIIGKDRLAEYLDISAEDAKAIITSFLGN